MTQKTRTYIAIAAAVGVALMPLQRAGAADAQSTTQAQQSEQGSSSTSTHGFMNGTEASQSLKTPELSINVGGKNSKANANACGSNLKINADHESNVNVTIICNNGDHNNIKAKSKANHNNAAVEQKAKATSHATAKKAAPKADTAPKFQHYALYVPGDTLVISLRAQRILPQAGLPAPPAYAVASAFSTSDVRMLPDGHLAVVLWAQMSQGPVVIETSYVGAGAYYLAQAQVNTYLHGIGNNVQPLIAARNQGLITQLSDMPAVRPPVNTQYPPAQHGNPSQQPAYKNNGTGYDTKGYYVNVNESLQSMQRN